MPTPLRLFGGMLIAGVLTLWMAHHFERALAGPLVSVARVAMMATQEEFRVIALDVATEGPNQVLRLRANLAHPILADGRAFYPIEGWFQVTLTLGGIFGYGLLTLIVVLAWPAKPKEMLARFLISLPLMVLLLMVNITSTFQAELWGPIHDEIDAQRLWPIMAWSRFLMGGGGYVLALSCAVASIRLAAHLAAPKRAADQHYANLVIGKLS